MAAHLINTTTQRLRGSLISPLNQRLLLYHFALVETMPGYGIFPQRWGIPTLQYVAARGAWKEVLATCNPFKSLGEEPVISPSLSALKAIRRRQPRRPLILCQPALAKPIPSSKLKRLVRPGSQLVELLTPRDPFLPLYWLPGRPEISGVKLGAYSDFLVHPMDRHLWRRRRTNPRSVFRFTENGSLHEQLYLFGSNPTAPMSTQVKQALATLKNRFESEMRQHVKRDDRDRGGIFYVFSRNQERLQWFERDCKRFAPTCYRIHYYPNFSRLEPSLTHFVLVHDPTILMSRLKPEWDTIHLDGGWRTRLYRAVRQYSGRLRWESLWSPTGTATYEVKQGVLRFQRGGGGWICFGGGEEGDDENDAFQTRCMIHKCIHGRRPNMRWS